MSTERGATLYNILPYNQRYLSLVNSLGMLTVYARVIQNHSAIMAFSFCPHCRPAWHSGTLDARNTLGYWF